MKVYTLNIKHLLLILLLNPIFLHASSVPVPSASCSRSQSTIGQQPIRQGKSDLEEKEKEHKEQAITPQQMTLDEVAKKIVHGFHGLGEVSLVMNDLDLILADLPLLEAIDENNRDKIVELIRTKKGDVNAPDMRRPFLFALQQNNFSPKDLPALLQCCLNNTKNVRTKPLTAAEIQEKKKFWSGFTPIMKAAAAGDKDLVAFYLAEGADFMNSIIFDPLINISDMNATINGRSLACALERDINKKKHTFDDVEGQKLIPERILLADALYAALPKYENDNFDDSHDEHCICYGTFELTKGLDALQLAVIGGHISVVQRLLNAVINSETLSTDQKRSAMLQGIQ